MNVFNDDRLLHRLVFVRAGTHDTLAVMPFFNDGQIVASEKLAKKPGIVAVTCALHPWTHGYIAVFDHPYFAVTDKSGRFAIDSIAPGTYKVMLWHEGMGEPIERRSRSLLAARRRSTCPSSSLSSRAAHSCQRRTIRSTTIAAKISAR